ncbi:MAG TPA: hypothetical protein VFU51_02890 [Gaiellaceae bacterium]|nr:hypothetical protein [Gaiellaceae bacterium]
MRRVVAVLGALLALGVSTARADAPGPLPCGLPRTQPLWVDYADGMVPFWSTIFARPGIVGAASNFIVPPQLRAKGAKTVYFDLYMNNRVGTPSRPADPAVIQARADKLFDTAVASSGCATPLLALNELSGANLPTPWTPTTTQYRANVLALVQRLAERGARPFLLLPRRPYVHDEAADEWWRQAAQYADLVPEVYFSGPSVSKQGAVLGSRRLRGTMRTRLEDLLQIGIPTSRLGMMLQFSSTRGAGGREGLQPLSKWLDVVKWEALAAKQVAGELHVATVWSWGWAAFNPSGNDPDKPTVACTYLWTRDHSLCDAPALAGAQLDQSVDVGATLPAGTVCLLGKTRLRGSDVAAIARMVGDREVAFSAGFAHAVLVEAKPVATKDVLATERTVILDRFRGERAAYLAALARAKVTPGLARTILADELRRQAVERTLHVAAPTARELQDWYATHAGTKARAIRVKKQTTIVLAPADRIFALPAGKKATIDGVQLQALGEAAPLGAFPFALAAPAVRTALVAELKDDAFATWVRRRENQSLNDLACAHDALPKPATIDLTDWVPFLGLG